AIEKELADAKAMRSEAESVGEQYKHRLSDWEKEREAARQTLHGEIEAERARLKEALAAELEQQRKKARVLDERRLAELRKQAETDAVVRAGRFLGRMLDGLTGPELEARIIAMVHQQLRALPEERVRELDQAWSANREAIVVQSAFALDKKTEQGLQQDFAKLLGPTDAAWQFRVTPELVAGLHISIGAWILAANLRDEMRFFMDAGRETD
ncbi:MAG TPA: F0F1 ATP synthase subunit delta, partial [Mariprofundaceae bacterium]|nr:F0F1 ATP synthase subunit delta [Mariprofundaceae bacterium]